jgi:erythronate-4-phosphate dehydrogenase
VVRENSFAFSDESRQYYRLLEKLMIIAIDRALPFWRESFEDLGEVRPFTGKELQPEDIRTVEALIVRTVTPVNASLLEGSAIRFVGAASAGMDHVDSEYLEKKGIHFRYSAGCNADAVAEYILTALHTVAARRNWNLQEKSLAVIGVGNVGSRVVRKTRNLGMKVFLCDPPLKDLTGDPQYESFESVLKADILTFHVPLTTTGPYPTWHMLNRDILNRLSPEQYLINACRGEVFDNRELKSYLSKGKILGTVLDVWEGEPAIDYELLELADIGTSHVAGTTLDGKIKAVEMMRAELCRFLGRPIPESNAGFYPKVRHIHPDSAIKSQDVIASVLHQAYAIEKDDADLRALAGIPTQQSSVRFEQLRIQHTLRPEFPHFIVDLNEQQKNLAEIFTNIGFKAKC